MPKKEKTYESKLQVLIDYFERNRKYIPCYVIRDKLGLRNSSNIGEKMNDLIVSERQKHNGMSWSKSGSVALASITTMVRNNEQDNWFKNKNIKFKIEKSFTNVSLLKKYLDMKNPLVVDEHKTPD